MSLINEALKKVQRIQHEEPTAAASALPYPAAPIAARRGKSNGGHNLVLLGAGALVLVVLSVFFTVYLVNRPSDSNRVARSTPAPITPPSSTTTPATTPSADSSTPAIVPPKITLPTATPPTETVATTPSTNAAPTASNADAQPSATSTRPASAASAGSTASAPTTASAAPVAAAISAPPAVAPAAATTTAAPLSPTASDERVAAFVESVRVTGIRSSGTDSRVLMNERVYRVNDIVERTLGVRLIKAEAERLTFSDSRGVTYVKRF